MGAAWQCGDTVKLPQARHAVVALNCIHLFVWKWHGSVATVILDGIGHHVTMAGLGINLVRLSSHYVHARFDR